MKRMKVSKNAFVEKADTELLQRLSFRYLPYWPLFLIAIILSLAAAWLYLKYKTPVYEVTGSILVKDQKKGLDESKVEDALNLFGEKKIIENEIEVIRSRSIISQIVSNLNLYATMEEGSEFITRPAYLSSPVTIELEKPDNLLHEANKVKFSYNDFSKTIVTEDGTTYPVGQWIDSYWGKIRFLKDSLNPANGINAGKSFFFSLTSLPKAINKVQNEIEISSSNKLSSVINISYKDPVPARGEAIVNELIRVYEQADVNDKNSTAKNTLDFVEKRLQLASKQLDDIEANVQKFRTDNDVVDVSQQSNQYLQNVGENDQKLSEMDVQLSILDQIESYILTKQDRPGLVPTTLGIKDGMLSQLLDKLYDSEIQVEKLKRTTAEDNPIMVSVRNEIEKIKPSILENVKNQRSSIQAARNQLLSTSSHYNAMLNRLPSKEKELAKISRQQNIDRSIYSFLLQKKEEASLAFNAAVSGSRIIDRAQSSTAPVSPKAWMVFLIALILPVPLFACAIDAREQLSNKILFRRTIEELTVIPVIGELGYEKAKSLLVVSNNRRTAVTEQFRNLRNSAVSNLSKVGGKTIIVTSSIAGEGKSFVAINLAVVMAQAGKKTVLIEADMYKPKLGSVFHLKNSYGLSEVLQSANHPMWFSAIHRSSIHDNLFFIPSGTAPGMNPSELLMSDNFGILMKELANGFDIIIIDSVPVKPVPDAFTINRFADMTLFVVRHGVTPKEQVLIMDEDIKIQNLININIVFNGIKRRGMATSGFGYSFGYGFESKEGYGYYSKGKQRPSVLK
ncbi:MAG: capsular biosynthesis protein [Bacteroidetes bacterium]|nr:MAG: capsular biosynthesis protein [Bacteroidota bacterium]